jgi:hypothetical protein
VLGIEPLQRIREFASNLGVAANASKMAQMGMNVFLEADMVLKRVDLYKWMDDRVFP